MIVSYPYTQVRHLTAVQPRIAYLLVGDQLAFRSELKLLRGILKTWDTINGVILHRESDTCNIIVF